MTAVTLPRVRESAKIARTEADLSSIKTALATYYAVPDNGSYPPAYGYRTWISHDQNQNPAAPLDPVADWDIYYWHTLYVDFPSVELRDIFDLYDEWSRAYDTDDNGAIDHLEFDPIVGPPNPIYDEPFAVADGFDTLTGADDRTFARPYIYIPVNKAQIKKVRRYYEDQNDYKASTWDPTNQVLANLVFPPPRYDSFALISVGPQENTCGIVNPPAAVLANIKAALAANGTSQDLYHVLGLRAYYLASRDLNKSGELDYDFRSRRKGEGKPEAFPDHAAFNVHEMPAPGKNLYGPIILIQEG
jgi:hypothetical protein